MNAVLTLLALTLGQNLPFVDTEPLADEMFRPLLVESARLSPDGSLIALKTQANGKQTIDLVDPIGLTQVTLVRAGDGVNNFVRQHYWAGDQTLILHAFSSRTAAYSYWIVRFEKNADGSYSASSTRQVRAKGLIVDPLPHDEHHVLFQRTDRGGVYRAVIEADGRFDEDSVAFRKRINKRFDKEGIWLSDRKGNPRLVVARDEEQTNIWYWEAKRKRFRVVHQLPADVDFTPMALNANDHLLYALSDRGVDRVQAITLSLDGSGSTSVVYAHPEYDVSYLDVDATTRQPVSVGFVHQGRTTFHYLDRSDGAFRNELATLFENDGQAYLIGGEAGGNRLLLIESATNPGVMHFYNAKARETVLVSELAPWLKQRELAETHTLKTTSRDGLSLEGHVVLPTGTGPFPVVVMPHGGPIDVQDTNHFDSESQFFAALGIAVIKVNYRGSGGYGRQFRDEGKGQWGKGIENDVMDFLDASLDKHPLDRDRVCIFGSSYGGYSAMMSVIHHPDRFRCAASFAGPMDIALMFSSSDWASQPKLVEKMKSIVGDPLTNRRAQNTLSPLYNAETIQRPVLIMHGAYDRRVDVEHYYRMKETLEALGKQAQYLLMTDTGHGFITQDQATRFYRRVAQFLRTNLD